MYGDTDPLDSHSLSDDNLQHIHSNNNNIDGINTTVKQLKVEFNNHNDIPSVTLQPINLLEATMDRGTFVKLQHGATILSLCHNDEIKGYNDVKYLGVLLTAYFTIITVVSGIIVVYNY
jgi:hypothetical protein